MPGHPRHEASMLHYYSSTSQRRFVRNEHPVAMLLGGERVRRVLYLTSVLIKPPPSFVICAHKLIVSLISGYMIHRP
jgi:hypothetical protein